MADEAKLHSLIRSTFDYWLCDLWSGVVIATQRQLQVLGFSEYLIDLLSVLLRCSSFPRIQKAVMDQTGSRPPNSDQDRFLVKIWLWEVLWSCCLDHPLRWLSLVVIYNPLFVAYHNMIEKWFIVVK